MKRIIGTLLILAAAGAFAALAVGTATASPRAGKADQVIKLVVKSDTEHAKKGSDGKWHDAFLPANLSVRAGQPATVTVSNYDDSPHSFTSSALHLNVTIPAAKGAKPGTKTFTFTASKPGSYLWWCAKPCDPWAMAHVGFMRGYIRVVA